MVCIVIDQVEIIGMCLCRGCNVIEQFCLCFYVEDLGYCFVKLFYWDCVIFDLGQQVVIKFLLVCWSYVYVYVCEQGLGIVFIFVFGDLIMFFLVVNDKVVKVYVVYQDIS